MKPIRIDTYIPTIMEAVERSLHGIKACDTKVNISWDISDLFKAAVKDLLKPHIDITAEAWTKMMMLVNSCTTELAWHCLIDRIDRDHFLVTDVLMYPQEVTGTAVDSNDAKYPAWLNAIDDDTFARMRGQGHSHVNMAVAPSGADTAFYQRLLSNVTDYYIFFIVNKRQDVWVHLYDVQHNLIYEEKDIVLGFVDKDGNDLELWASEQLEFIEKVPLGQKKELAPVTPTYPSQPPPRNDNWNTYRDATGRVDYQGRPLNPYAVPIPEVAWTERERKVYEDRQLELQIEEMGRRSGYEHYNGYRD